MYNINDTTKNEILDILLVQSGWSSNSRLVCMVFIYLSYLHKKDFTDSLQNFKAKYFKLIPPDKLWQCITGAYKCGILKKLEWKRGEGDDKVFTAHFY